MEKPSTQTFVVIILLVGVVVSTFAAAYYYRMYTMYEAKVPKEQKEADKDIDMTLQKLGKLMVLPAERPSLAVVKDADKLKTQQKFFAQAQNGDKLLIFRTARKAILYRPSTNKIIESGPLLVSPNAQTGQQTQSVKIAIYNGTTDATLATATDEKIRKAANAPIETSLGTAKSTSYTKTLVVDLTGNNKQSVEELAKFLTGEVSALPDGETKPATDILIIVGNTP